jgi:2-polyprenyl-3-methyl-5-hydroxy-6-metoxy-1,4-benzoquinol methylase
METYCIQKDAEMKYSFIVDNHPKFHLQAYYLLTTLTRLGNVSIDQIIVHYAGEIPAYFRKSISDRFNIDIRQVEKNIHPYCNKIQQLETFLNTSEDVVLLDCDTVVTRPVSWPRIESVAAKRVDTATPPKSVISEIYKTAGLPINWAQSDCKPGNEGCETPIHNYNGGLYVINSDVIPEVYERWKNWSHFCIENKHLFGKYYIYIDQVAFSLSMTELDLSVLALHRQFNFPTHHTLSIGFDCKPYILHYHWMLDEQQVLKKTGLTMVDSEISRVNNCIIDERNNCFNHQFFWDYYYSNDSCKKNSDKTRTINTEAKYNILQRVVEAGDYRSILDIGCGDIESTHRLKGNFKYLGIDTSIEALKLAKNKRREWEFQVYSDFICSLVPESYNLVFCLDVLIHQSSKMKYDEIVQLITTATNDTLVVTGYDDTPVFTSSYKYYYENISDSIRKTGLFSEVFTVAKYADISVIIAKKNRHILHPRDISPEHVSDVVGWTKNPMLFRELLDFSRTRIGFFPDHTPRAIEYAWIVNEVSSRHNQQTILDVGAGVSCLPLYLSRLGNKIITIDQSPLIRRLEQRKQWNEWGFFDYSQLDPRIESINTSFESGDINRKFDTIYSVSVIEHLLASVRKIWLKRMRSLLKPKGRILLTVDLLPPGDDLWIFAEGKVVEENHGTFRTLYEEIKAEGFIADDIQILQAIPGSRVDIAMISARLSDTAFSQ